MRYFFIVIFWVQAMHGVLITLDIFQNTAGKLIYLFGDHHAINRDVDLEQLTLFAQALVDKDELSPTIMHLLVEQPPLYDKTNIRKITTSILEFLTKNKFHSVTGEDIELRSVAIAAHFLLIQKPETVLKQKDRSLLVKGQPIQLGLLTFNDIKILYNTLTDQAKKQHKKLFNTKEAKNFFIFGQKHTQEQKKELIKELKKLKISKRQPIIEIYQELYQKSLEGELDCKQQIIEFMHNMIDPLFRLLLLHKIYAHQAQKIVVITGYSHSKMLEYFLEKLNYVKVATYGSCAEPINPIPLAEDCFKDLIKINMGANTPI